MNIGGTRMTTGVGAGVFAAAAGLAVSVSAQTPILIDVNPYTPSSADASPANFVRLGDSVLFSANDGTNGTELWTTDGTPGGTMLLKDINPGSGSSSPANFNVFGSRVLFSANDGSTGVDLWITDGTADGTQLVTEVRPGTSTASFSSDWGVVGSFGTPGSFVVFGANNGSVGSELWKTDGTAGGTSLLANINTTSGTASSNPSGFYTVGSSVYFLANEGSTGSLKGNELWVTDGTAGGTVRVTDIAPNTASSAFSIDVDADGWGYGAANALSSGNDQEPWAFNFATQTTVPLGDLNPGTSSSNPQEFVRIGNSVYFRATRSLALGGTDNQLYKVTFDGLGAPTGAVVVLDINPTGNDNVGNITVFDGELYFAATDGVNGRELWKSDGTAVGTVQVANINPGAGDSTPGGFVAINSRLFFSASTDTTGRELYAFDATTSTVTLLADLRSGFANGVVLTPPASELNGVLLFAASGTTVGTELYRTSGSPVQTALVKDIRPQSDATVASAPTLLTVSGGRVFFTATDEAAGRELWVSNGTTAGTVRVIDANPGTSSGSPSAITPFGADVLFSANGGTSSTLGQTGIEYYRTTGNTAAIVADINPGTGSSAPGAGVTIAVLNGSAYFNATSGSGAGLWKYDGVNTTLVSGSTGTSPSEITAANGEIFFRGVGSGTGSEPQRSDGNSVTFIEDYWSGGTSSNAGSFFGFDNKVFMRASADNTTGSELAVFDPLLNDIYLVQDIRPGSNGSFSSVATSGQQPNFTVFNNALHFLALDGGNNLQLWTATSGVGSAVVKSAAVGNTVATLAKSGNYLYFAAGSGSSTNVELWAYDGVANAGQAFLVAEINSTAGSSPTSLTDVNGRLYFAATGDAGGAELYRVTFDILGVPNGAELVADINPGSASSSPRNFAADGARLYFTADDGVHGEELWVLDTATAVEACCRGTTCTITLASNCTAPAGVGVATPGGAACNAPGVATSPCCYSDFDKNGSRDIDDIFIYLNAWFTPARNPFCKIGGDGVAVATIDDLFIFLNIWFAGGC